MEQQHLIKLLEERVAILTDGARAINAHAEDIAFRAQHIANAAKNGFPCRDRMFGDDLTILHKGINTYGGQIMELPNSFSQLEREAAPKEADMRSMQSLFRAVSALQKELRGLQMTMSLAHQHIRNTSFKVESTYIAIELEKITQKSDLIPQTCNKILGKIGAAPVGPTAPSGPRPPGP